MANMAHCQFENTLQAVKQCIETLERRDISRISEVKYAYKLFVEFLEFCEAKEIIDGINYGKIDELLDEQEETE